MALQPPSAVSPGAWPHPSVPRAAGASVVGQGTDAGNGRFRRVARCAGVAGIGGLTCAARRKRRGQRQCRLAAVGQRALGAELDPKRLGVHALVFTGGLEEEDIRFAAEGAAASGFGILEVPLLDLDAVDPKMVLRVLQSTGVSATASLGLPFDADVSSEDSETVARGEARLASAVEVAAGFGSRHLCGILYSGFGKYSAPPTARGRANAVEAIRRLAQRADGLGVQINLEVVNRYETNLLNTASQALEFCNDVNMPNVRIHLDTYHMNIEEASFSAAVSACGSQLGYVHLGESHRGYLGTGTVAWDEFFTALHASEYEGPLTFESFSNKVVAPYCVDALCIWRNLWEESSELARDANSFIGDTWSRTAGKS